jgi:hypothetical protein
MFDVGEYVVNQKTGHLGKVIGYGHQIHNGVYITTLKVIVNDSAIDGKRGVIEEDLYSAWSKYRVSNTSLFGGE